MAEEFNYYSALIRHERHTTTMCKYREMPLTGCAVECDSLSRCATCGWNPEVEEERKRILRTKIADKRTRKPIWLLGRGEYRRRMETN